MSPSALGAVEPGRGEAVDRRLVAGRRRDLRPGPEVGEVGVLDRRRVGQQQARRPEPVGQVVAAGLELGREAAVEDDDSPAPGHRGRRRGVQGRLSSIRA